MYIKSTLALALVAVVTFRVSAQNILHDYFKGNKDSLVAEATKLISMPEPDFLPGSALKIEQAKERVRAKSCYFTARDGQKLFSYRLPAKSGYTILLLHGIKSTAKDYLDMAEGLYQATHAELYALDLRGHGKSAGKDADVAYIDQYADDLTDIIRVLRRRKPQNKIILAGHSMGGGIALRFAALKGPEQPDGFLLVAPLLGQNSPAIRSITAPADANVEPFMKIHFPRIIGLKMLNEIGDHGSDSLQVLFFNLPKNAPMRAYTYRANQSMAPDNYRDGLTSIQVPLLVLIGSRDEAFSAEATKKAVEQNSKGRVEIIEGETHDGITKHASPYLSVAKWLKSL